MSPRLSRRAFLGSTASFAILGQSVGQGAQAASLSQAYDTAIWQALVSTIAGPVELEPALRTALTTGFTAKFGLPALSDLVARFGHNGVYTALDPQPAPYEDQIQWIAGYLFTGSADPSDSTAQIENYPHALAWKSLRFAKAPGFCDGPEFGYWLKPWSIS
ncbi:MAG: hypothetical protein ACPGNV_14820 [Mangrovicoccus sp.]